MKKLLNTGFRGMTMAEYALLGVGIAVAVFAMVTALGGQLNQVFSNIKSKLGNLN